MELKIYQCIMTTHPTHRTETSGKAPLLLICIPANDVHHIWYLMGATDRHHILTSTLRCVVILLQIFKAVDLHHMGPHMGHPMDHLYLVGLL